MWIDEIEQILESREFKIINANISPKISSNTTIMDLALRYITQENYTLNITFN